MRFLALLIVACLVESVVTALGQVREHPSLSALRAKFWKYGGKTKGGCGWYKKKWRKK
ncbi:hypothetical protein PF008_g20039 [Phytophthora fragariae]|uniref:RxLR effector protein n=1 Tax=Phytophthora fragariae TaxID=53985 RepID=A0A6G0R0N1_9STRA|nr:hypothetical protein PF008_g20039 [Phytophthora fragariae]